MPAIRETNRCQECKGKGVERLHIYVDGELLVETMPLECGVCEGSGESVAELVCATCGLGLDVGAFVVAEDGTVTHVVHLPVRICVA